MNYMKLTLLILVFCIMSCENIPDEPQQPTQGLHSELDQYNIVWNTPSRNSSESMPVGGHDIGLNVWVENGDVLFYAQRSGSFTENNEYHTILVQGERTANVPAFNALQMHKVDLPSLPQKTDVFNISLELLNSEGTLLSRYERDVFLRAWRKKDKEK